MTNDDIIDRLVAYRNLLHKTSQDIADAIGISVTEVERMESKQEITPIPMLKQYADSLGMELRFETSADKRITKRRPLPIGVTDFRTLSSKFSYVDKTLLIKEILEQETTVTLFTRPRRFGKTSNMDMLRVFFEKTEDDTSVYFKDKKIWRCGEDYRKHQGQYPVIFLTFKDVKYATWEDNINCLKFILATEFNRHQELFESDKCDKFEKRYYKKVAYGEATEIELAQALLFLSRMLAKHHGKKAFIMIDEYDTPIQQGHMRGYYDQAVTFMRNFLSIGLKDNHYLAYGFLTGILRVAKESIFSSLNNVKVNSVLDDQYSEFFGFTPEEVQQLVVYYGVPEKYEEICEWYDGYRFGQTDIFNPWSVIGYLDNQCKPQAYWVSTAKNDVIGEILTKVSNETRKELHMLLQGQSVCTQVDTSVIYPELQDDSASVYSFLLVSGYLKVVKKHLINGEYICEVAIPNIELFSVFRKEILSKMKHVIPPSTVMKIHEALYKNDAEGLQRELHKLLLQTVSYNDAASENFYHGFVLGLCAMLDNRYYVTSNRESGEGRFDIGLMPRQLELPGILMELKSAKSMTEELKELAQKALEQIESKKYDEDMKMQGVHEIYKYGVAFCGKDVEVVTKIGTAGCV
ncbi:MAG: AAA family ATPase [Tyzzerella sp.]|nr:AAA family ATPase [Tyzzerella sp.]